MVRMKQTFQKKISTLEDQMQTDKNANSKQVNMLQFQIQKEKENQQKLIKKLSLFMK